MAPKPKPARFTVGMVLAMALTILAVMTWADRDLAAPRSSSIYHPQLLVLY
jgi:heme/copper-type cytochrome/quinol oxidase subunit 4